MDWTSCFTTFDLGSVTLALDLVKWFLCTALCIIKFRAISPKHGKIMLHVRINPPSWVILYICTVFEGGIKIVQNNVGPPYGIYIHFVHLN